MTLLDLCADTYTEKVARLFRSMPNVWIHWTAFAGCGGALAWRSRIAECRKAPYFMVIENKQTRDERGVKHSYYRYVPAARRERDGQ